MTGSSRLTMVVASALLVALAACGRPSPDAEGRPQPGPATSPSATVEHLTDASALEQFCARFGQDMSTLQAGDEGEDGDRPSDAQRRATLTDLEALLASAPEELRVWAATMTTWARAQLDDDTEAVQQLLTASDEASYRIASRCESLHVD